MRDLVRFVWFLFKMAMLEGLVDIAEIQHMVWRGMSHRNIAITIQERFPGRRGISERSIRRFCRSNNISRISNVQLDLVVQDFVELYGHGYGRAMMQGSIRSFIGATTGVISQRRVSQSLLRVAPLAYEERTRDIFERTYLYHIMLHILVTSVTWSKMKR